LFHDAEKLKLINWEILNFKGTGNSFFSILKRKFKNNVIEMSCLKPFPEGI